MNQNFESLYLHNGLIIWDKGKFTYTHGYFMHQFKKKI